jgi:hypothetical protein
MSLFDTCPHCGGHSIEDNGLRRSNPDLTLLCTTRVKLDEASLDYEDFGDTPLDENGLVICGHQWNPHEGEN